MNGRPWTAEENDRLRELAATGMSQAQMADALGRGRAAVAHRIVRLRLRCRDDSAEASRASAPRQRVQMHREQSGEDAQTPKALCVEILRLAWERGRPLPHRDLGRDVIPDWVPQWLLERFGVERGADGRTVPAEPDVRDAVQRYLDDWKRDRAQRRARDQRPTTRDPS